MAAQPPTPQRKLTDDEIRYVIANDGERDLVAAMDPTGPDFAAFESIVKDMQYRTNARYERLQNLAMTGEVPTSDGGSVPSGTPYADWKRKWALHKEEGEAERLVAGGNPVTIPGALLWAKLHSGQVAKNVAAGVLGMMNTGAESASLAVTGYPIGSREDQVAREMRYAEIMSGRTPAPEAAAPASGGARFAAAGEGALFAMAPLFPKAALALMGKQAIDIIADPTGAIQDPTPFVVLGAAAVMAKVGKAHAGEAAPPVPRINPQRVADVVASTYHEAGLSDIATRAAVLEEAGLIPKHTVTAATTPLKSARDSAEILLPLRWGKRSPRPATEVGITSHEPAPTEASMKVTPRGEVAGPGPDPIVNELASRTLNLMEYEGLPFEEAYNESVLDFRKAAGPGAIPREHLKQLLQNIAVLELPKEVFVDALGVGAPPATHAATGNLGQWTEGLLTDAGAHLLRGGQANLVSATNAIDGFWAKLAKTAAHGDPTVMQWFPFRRIAAPLVAGEAAEPPGALMGAAMRLDSVEGAASMFNQEITNPLLHRHFAPNFQPNLPAMEAFHQIMISNHAKAVEFGATQPKAPPRTTEEIAANKRMILPAQKITELLVKYPQIKAAASDWKRAVQEPLEQLHKANGDKFLPPAPDADLDGVWVSNIAYEPTVHRNFKFYDPATGTFIKGKPNGAEVPSVGYGRKAREATAGTSHRARGTSQAYLGDLEAVVKAVYIDKARTLRTNEWIDQVQKFGINKKSVFTDAKGDSMPSPTTGRIEQMYPKTVLFGGKEVPVKSVAISDTALKLITRKIYEDDTGTRVVETSRGITIDSGKMHLPEPVARMVEEMQKPNEDRRIPHRNAFTQAAEEVNNYTTAFYLLNLAEGIQHAVSLYGPMLNTEGIGQGTVLRPLAWTSLALIPAWLKSASMKGPEATAKYMAAAEHLAVRPKMYADMAKGSEHGAVGGRWTEVVRRLKPVWEHIIARERVFGYPGEKSSYVTAGFLPVPKGFELRTKVWVHDAILAGAKIRGIDMPDAEAWARAANDTGVYAAHVAPALVKWMRTTLPGVADPFITASTSLTRNAIKGMMGISTGGWWSGEVFWRNWSSLMFWPIAINYMLHGVVPLPSGDKDQQRKFLETYGNMPLGSIYLGKAKDGTPRYLPMRFINPAVGRAATVTGLPSLWRSAFIDRQPMGRVAQAWTSGVVNGLVVNRLNPAFEAGYIGATGRSPRFTSTFDHARIVPESQKGWNFDNVAAALREFHSHIRQGWDYVREHQGEELAEASRDETSKGLLDAMGTFGSFYTATYGLSLPKTGQMDEAMGAKFRQEAGIAREVAGGIVHEAFQKWHTLPTDSPDLAKRKALAREQYISDELEHRINPDPYFRWIARETAEQTKRAAPGKPGRSAAMRMSITP